MKLYFLRHGIADWPAWDLARDDERPLNEDGIQKMKAEAKTIERLDLKLDAILTSPLVRARQTADLVAHQLALTPIEEAGLAHGFNLDHLRDIMGRHPNARALMLVGHEPSFSATMGQLIGGGRIQMKKGGLGRIDVDSFEPLGAQLVWLLTPKQLATL